MSLCSSKVKDAGTWSALDAARTRCILQRCSAAHAAQGSSGQGPRYAKGFPSIPAAPTWPFYLRQSKLGNNMGITAAAATAEQPERIVDTNRSWLLDWCRPSVLEQVSDN